MTEKNIPGTDPQKNSQNIPDDIKSLFKEISDAKVHTEKKEKEDEAAKFAEGRFDLEDPMFNG